MAKITYTNLGLKTKEEKKEIKINGKTVEVLQYLPFNDKYDLVTVALQKALEGQVYNPVKKDMYFHLNLIYLYTNISFTDKQRENEEKIYDTFASNGYLDLIIEAIPDEEYEMLYNYMEELESDLFNYNNSTAGIVSNLIQDLPSSANAVQEIIENFDLDKLQNVVNFATSLNGGRPVL